MKFGSKEAVWFNDAAYARRMRRMSPDELYLRSSRKHRTKVSSGTGVGYYSLLTMPTLGVAAPALWYNGRTLDIARRKERIIKKELAARCLPPYENTLRDTLVPLGISLAVIATIGVVDLVVLPGMSSLAADEAANHLITAVATSTDHSTELAGLVKYMEVGQAMEGSIPVHLAADAVLQGSAKNEKAQTSGKMAGKTA